MNKKLFVLLGVVIALIGGIAAIKFGNIGTSVLWNLSQEGKWVLPLVGISALIDSINPCAFSVLLLTIAFLLSVGKLRSGILKIGSFYIAGIFVAYILIGLGILQTLHFFNTPNFMAKAAAVLLLALGSINLINHYFPSFPIKLKIPSFAHPKMASLMEHASLPTAFFLGALVALCEFPCTGGPYLLVLGLLHDQATYWKGMGYLIFYNLLFVLPLVLILLLASERSLLERVQTWQRQEAGAMRFWSGIAMVVLAVLILLI